MKTVIVATGNAHKVEEIAMMLSQSIRCLSLRGIAGIPGIVESGTTFQANAALKCVGVARYLAECPDLSELRRSWGEWSVLADDSGLEVDALNGAPGVHSARFAALGTDPADSHTGPQRNSPDGDNNAKLMRLLSDVPEEKRTARFRCVLAWSRCGVDGRMIAPEFCEGACEGRILLSPSGVGGFGYDPLFVPEGETQSFAELGAETKNRLSHRAVAVGRLRALMTSRGWGAVSHV